MSSSVAAEVRRQQRVDELSSATVRAVSGDPDVHFRGRRLYRGGRPDPSYAPHLRPGPDDDFESFRGAADGLALRLRHGDAALHRALAPDGEVAGLVFEMLEQFRVESMASSLTAPGMVRNLRHRHETWSRAFHVSGLTETSSGMLLYTVAQVCRARVVGEPVLEATEDLLEETRFAIAPLIGSDLAGLRRTRTEQAAYAVHAASLARSVAALVQEADEAAPRSAAARRRARDSFTLLLDRSEGDEQLSRTDAGEGRLPPIGEDRYRVYTRAYDRQVRASALVRPAQSAELREHLDARVLDSGISVTRLARELRSILARPVDDGSDGGQEDGVIDGRSLTQLVVSPTERRVFRTERVEPRVDCLVTLLVDCSGSMRQSNESTALVVDVMARALDLAGVRSEVLGFTTRSWNGGRAARDWRRAGRPADPGRLNELEHIVFKDADTSWRRARRDIAGLLKGDLYREGVDGEAVGWACARMAERPEHRRILVVITDGGPTDSATSLANDEHYLDHHLREVVAHEEGSTTTRVCGLGIGLDLRSYYCHSQALDIERPLGHEDFGELLTLIAAGGRQ